MQLNDYKFGATDDTSSWAQPTVRTKHVAPQRIFYVSRERLRRCDGSPWQGTTTVGTSVIIPCLWRCIPPSQQSRGQKSRTWSKGQCQSSCHNIAPMRLAGTLPTNNLASTDSLAYFRADERGRHGWPANHSPFAQTDTGSTSARYTDCESLRVVVLNHLRNYQQRR